MKIRKGLVSNSSSSSFVCDACGEHYEGWDGDYGSIKAYECVNGHDFCSDCLIDTPKAISSVLKEGIANGYILKENFEEEELKEIEELTFDCEIEELGIFEEYDIPPQLCPMCNLKSIPDYMILDYLLDKLGKEKSLIKEEMRNEKKTRIS